MALSNDLNDTATGIGVSKALYETKANLIRASADLEGLLHNRISWYVRDARSRLEADVCRIAFVGQVKAGKSSLINALIKKPGLLPTDINPSTAVVTKVFLGSAEHQENTALFHFFTESEWEGLMSGTGQGSEGRGVQSLPSSRARLNELQRRAERRLGPNYSKFLGKHHLFSAITPQVIEQYVSAGDYKPAPASGPLLYSDVTKMAEVFLKGLPFSYPSVMIDTPGVNDLFFVRDEITHANLADADIYIVVISAQNPLSSADLSLLRLLRGLQRDRIIAVVNRIDSLDDIAEDTKRIENFVRDTLKREFPHAAIPVLPVSAFWATAALSDNQEQLNEAFSARFDKFAQEKHKLMSSQAGVGLRTKAALMSYSGIPRLINFISRSITTSVTEERLLPSATAFTSIAHNTGMSTRLSLRALASDKVVRSSAGIMRDKLRLQLQKSLDELADVVSGIEKILSQIIVDLEHHANDEVKNLERFLFFQIDKYAELQAKAYASKNDLQAFIDKFVKDALRFRSELSDDFARHHTTISKSLLDKQSEAEAVLRRKVQEQLPNLDGVLQFGFSSRKTRPPSVMALAKATTLETEEFWRILESSAAAGENPAGNIKLIITSEFLLILKEMLETAQADLKLTVNDMMTRLRLMTLSTIFPLIESLSLLSDIFSGKGHPTKTQIEPSQLMEFRTGVESKARQQQDTEKRLNEIKKQCLLIPIGH